MINILIVHCLGILATSNRTRVIGLCTLIQMNFRVFPNSQRLTVENFSKFRNDFKKSNLVPRAIFQFSTWGWRSSCLKRKRPRELGWKIILFLLKCSFVFDKNLIHIKCFKYSLHSEIYPTSISSLKRNYKFNQPMEMREGALRISCKLSARTCEASLPSHT